MKGHLIQRIYPLSVSCWTRQLSLSSLSFFYFRLRLHCAFEEQSLMEFLIFSPSSAIPSALSSTYQPGSALILPQSARLLGSPYDLHTATSLYDANFDDAAPPNHSITIPPMTAAAMLATATLRSSPLLQPGSAVDALSFFRESLSGMVVSPLDQRPRDHVRVDDLTSGRDHGGVERFCRGAF